MSVTPFLNKLRIVKQVLLSKPEVPDNSQLFDCPVCGASNITMHSMPAAYFGLWQKYQTVHNPFYIETMNIEYYLCSKCYTSDRNRLYALYLNEWLATAQDTIQLLDIAPDNEFTAFIKSKPSIDYRSMDLLRPDADDNFDITDMHAYADGRFHFFICSHVLEHIPDDKKAISELYRILKKGGKGIVMVPLNLQLTETMEDAVYTTEAQRWKYFFQGDHVRMYAKHDFINRLTDAGFTVQQLGIDYFTEQVYRRNAIYPTSVLYVVSKN